MMTSLTVQQVTPEMVRPILARHLLTDGIPIVLDLARSQGVRLYDQLTGRELIDFFGFFASSTVGMNHPKMLNDAEFRKRLMEAALNKVTNSDIYTVHMARFVQTFERVGIPEYLPYAFFIDGGALAVENALKAAFDWKVRKNFRKGYRREVGHRVLHFDQAFHGRTGYTLSLTNTFDPRKTQYFPKFDWPRVINPKLTFPLTEENLERTRQLEELALRQAKQYFYDYKDDIACIIIEPIQAEGGDNHFRPEFLQALRELADENDALLIFDEVQTGVGITGAFWAHQALGVQPDLIAFGKKTQVCGILASRRLDEVEDNVFHVPSRLNSTWGGNLADMVRFDRILEIIEEDDLVAHAGKVGAYLLQRLEEMAQVLPFMTNVRGRGLMCAFDLPTPAFRDAVRQQSLEEGVIVLGCGERSIRFRPPLVIVEEEIDEGLRRLRHALERVAQRLPWK
jgi:L-lysine 6-transaminase